MIIAIDFDGTIVKHNFPEIGIPISGAFETMKRLKQEGHSLILWTCRNNVDQTLNGRRVLDEAISYCKENGIEFNAVNCNVDSLAFDPIPKVYADFYVDDRSFPFVNPEHIWEMLNEAIDNPSSILNQKVMQY